MKANEDPEVSRQDLIDFLRYDCESEESCMSPRGKRHEIGKQHLYRENLRRMFMAPKQV